MLAGETFTAMYFCRAVAYPDELIEWREDEVGHEYAVGPPEPEAGAVAAALAHCIEFHPDYLK